MSDDEERGDEAAYSMVMPLVVCRTNGGPYEDRPFVAGARYAQIETELRLLKPEEHEVYVEPELVPQLDLVAMNEGYTLTAVPWDEHPDEWVLATFVKVAASPDGAGPR